MWRNGRSSVFKKIAFGIKTRFKLGDEVALLGGFRSVTINVTIVNGIESLKFCDFLDVYFCKREIN